MNMQSISETREKKKKNTLLKQYSKITGREEEIYFKEHVKEK